MKKLFFLTTIVAVAMSISSLQAQGDKSKRASPPAKATETIKSGATISIDYSQPSVKGRTIGKDIAPYDHVWRLGANEATLFETSQDVKVAGKALQAGKYSLYAIPGEKEWTFIVNSQTGQWGITRAGETTDDTSKDVFRFNVKPKKSTSFTEKMTFTIDKSGKVSLFWGDLDVSFDVK